MNSIIFTSAFTSGLSSGPGAEPGGHQPAQVALVEPHQAAGHMNVPQHVSSEENYIALLFVFALATFIGLDVIRRVSRLLHTPLMSLTNAISAIAVVGAILIAGPKNPPWITALALVAVFAAVTNIVSGFLITDRMLKMFKKRDDKKP